MLNGQVYRFDELSRMIHRVISDENEVKKLTTVEEDLKEFDEEYLELRLDEVR